MLVYAMSCLCASACMAELPEIRKLGTIDLHLVETQPIVYRNNLYRFESVRKRYPGNTTSMPYFRFVDVASQQATPAFAEGHDLGCALVADERMWVFGTPGWGANKVQQFWSDDLKTWHSSEALSIEGWELFNTSVCRAGDRYVMAFEVGAPANVAGQRFTARFAESRDLKQWTVLPEEAVYTKERYSACPTIRFVDKWFYLIYLEATGDYEFNPCIARSRDLRHWHRSKVNPIMRFGEEDKRVYNAGLNANQRDEIKNAVNRNNSDLDLCEYDGRVLINYSWGDQAGHEFLACAEYDGTLQQFFEACFKD